MDRMINATHDRRNCKPVARAKKQLLPYFDLGADLFINLGADALDLHQVLRRFEVSVFLTVLDNRFRFGWANVQRKT
jgi:hypothetical protein